MLIVTLALIFSGWPSQPNASQDLANCQKSLTKARAVDGHVCTSAHVDADLTQLVADWKARDPKMSRVELGPWAAVGLVEMDRNILLFGSAFKPLVATAVLGDVEAQWTIGAFLRRESQFEESVWWLRKAAEQGNAKAQLDLGLAYDGGQGVPQDLAQAGAWYMKAAQQGNATAQFDLGLMYATGKGMTADVAQALLWYRKSADQGDADAQFNLGLMYEQGRGVSQGFVQAMALYRKAAIQEHAGAQFRLGHIYDEGNGVPPDSVQALSWYRKAAEQGYVSAQFNLGVMYFQAQGVARDNIEAYKWLSLATARASAAMRQQCSDARDQVAKNMTPEQIAAAQRREREWSDAFEKRRN